MKFLIVSLLILGVLWNFLFSNYSQPALERSVAIGQLQDDEVPLAQTQYLQRVRLIVPFIGYIPVTLVTFTVLYRQRKRRVK